MLGLFLYDTLCMLNNVLKFLLKLAIVLALMLAPFAIEALIF